jgi:hypothetical protein
MADRAIKGDEKDTKVEDEMVAGDEDGNDEVAFVPLKARQWAYVTFRKKYLR